MAKRRTWVLAWLAALALVAVACARPQETSPAGPGATSPAGTSPAEEFVFGMILVGPKDDRGWSQAHFEAGRYVEQNLPGAKMIWIDKVNPTDRPETTVEQVVDDMLDQGARLVFATSDAFKDGILNAAREHPDVPMIWSSGDSAWAEGRDYHPELTNLGNIMGRMEFGKAIAGCAAALQTKTGHLGYLGPLINDETRRLANSAYLGARYCWEKFRGRDPADLKFDVKWIGFWFNIPGVTLDPTQVANEFFDSGADVVLSGIDTTEALVRAGQRASAGEDVFAIPYDYKQACGEAPEVCLGVPYFNWGPAYLETAKAVLDGTFKASFVWFGPDFSNPPDSINDPDTSGVGFVKGPALTAENSELLDEYITGLANGSIKLFVGPLNWQDGSPFLGPGEVATDVQIWYQGQLLEGMTGASSA